MRNYGVLRDKVKYAVAAILLIFGAYFIVNGPIDSVIYDYGTSKMIRIEDLDDIGDDEYLLYVGRKSCHYCRDLIRKGVIDKNIPEKMYYIDTDVRKSQKNKKQIKELKVEFVPTIVHIKNKSVVSREEEFS